MRPLTNDGDVDLARKEAVLAPKLIGDFLRKYDGAALPKTDIAKMFFRQWVFLQNEQRTPFQ
ncbi:hypothetical protein HDF10_000486 [Edaphobacter lichenicola]|uniref:Uncharacterized protein n=1 Tax=Tunturiibacter lichenicola TaxID=2051959 RepID=A0A7W8J4R0_9BACT|nr:hypothetical protein [Edaphobacter lichenicola]